MATVIRFSRHGTKKRPYFRIVVQDKQSPRDGKFLEHIGSYDPVKGATSIAVERDRLEYWLSVGAQLSESVKNRLKVVRKQWAAGTTEAAPEAKAPVAPKDKPAKAKSAPREA